MNEEKIPKTIRTLSLIGSEKELDTLYEDLAKLGWRLKYKGHSGSWLAEPIYEVRQEVKKEEK